MSICRFYKNVNKYIIYFKYIIDFVIILSNIEVIKDVFLFSVQLMFVVYFEM